MEPVFGSRTRFKYHWLFFLLQVQQQSIFSVAGKMLRVFLLLRLRPSGSSFLIFLSICLSGRRLLKQPVWRLLRSLCWGFCARWINHLRFELESADSQSPWCRLRIMNSPCFYCLLSLCL